MPEKYCLNCGEPVDDAFCPHCGQKTSVGRLSVKSAIIENSWSAVRMDAGVFPTAWLLVTKPWVVIREYIYGHRVKYTQPVRFIVIMCFVNLIVQLFLPETDTQAVTATRTNGETALMFLWHSIQNFLHDSEVAQDIIDSIILAPLVYVLYIPWGSRRFNFAEFSTAYIYICGAEMIISLILLPLTKLLEVYSPLFGLVGFLIYSGWLLYLFNGLVKHAFKIKRRSMRVLMMTINLILLVLINFFNEIVLYNTDISGYLQLG